MFIHRKTFTCLLTSVLTLLLALLCHAQRPVQILYYRAASDAPRDAYLYVGESLVAETELPRDNFSETFEIPAGNFMLRFLPAVLEEGQKAPKGAPAVSISEKWQKILLLVFEDKTNAAMPIRVQAIDASDKVFGPGSIYMVNFSEVGVAGTVGDKKLLLKPKAISIVKSPVSENGSYPAKLDKYVPGAKKPQRFIRQMWGQDDTVRQLLFILPKPAPMHATYYCAPISGLESANKQKRVPDSRN
ncbi:MAG: hypothetical protein ABJQ29_02740 [Luteolibacter sp.]